MKSEPVPYLCGGIFLMLLTEAKGKAASRRELRSGVRDKVSNKNMLEGLIKLFDISFEQPAVGRTFDGDTSDYRACKVSYGINLPFDNSGSVSGFDDRVKNQYVSVLRKMDEFIDDFLRTNDDERMLQLIRRLLTLVDKDHLITPNTTFYYAGTPITKTDLLGLDHYCLSNLMLCIWHFIVTKRPDNEAGRATFEALNDRADEIGAKWKFKNELGSEYTKKFDFDLFGTIEKGKAADEYVEDIKIDPANETESDVIEAEVMDNGQEYQEKTLVNHGRIYQQHAEKIVNIEHLDILNL